MGCYKRKEMKLCSCWNRTSGNGIKTVVEVFGKQQDKRYQNWNKGVGWLLNKNCVQQWIIIILLHWLVLCKCIPLMDKVRTNVSMYVRGNVWYCDLFWTGQWVCLDACICFIGLHILIFFKYKLQIPYIEKGKRSMWVDVFLSVIYWKRQAVLLV